MDKVNSLIKVLGDLSQDKNCRARAALELGKIGDKKASKTLIKCLTDRSARVQMAAAEALGNLGDREAIDPLIKSLNGDTYGLTDGDGSPSVYHGITATAAVALGKIGGDKALAALTRQLDMSDSGQKAAAAVGLGYIKDSRSFKALMSQVKTKEQFPRIFIAEALGRLRYSEALDPLVQFLHDPSYNVQIQAADSLGEMRDPRAVGPLEDVIKKIMNYMPPETADPNHIDDVRLCMQAACAKSLAQIGTASSLQLLEGYFRSSDWKKCTVAAIGLAYKKDVKVKAELQKTIYEKNYPMLEKRAIQAIAYFMGKEALIILEPFSKEEDFVASVIDYAREVVEQLKDA